jgi:hypothetical protein
MNRTDRDRYMCHSCGGVTVFLTKEEAQQERKEGHDVQPWPVEKLSPAEVRS